MNNYGIDIANQNDKIIKYSGKLIKYNFYFTL